MEGSFSIDEIRRRFAESDDFNEIFDAVEAAINQRIDDVELYRLLFWNNSLSSEAIAMFGEKIAREFPNIAYDIYMWLASVFEVSYSKYDNYEGAIRYYKKAAEVRPMELDPYLDAADCYDPDLNLPPADVLIEFLLQGLKHVRTPKPIYQRLALLYRNIGDDDMADFYEQKSMDK
jgi:tetratricopeptide (TPR) repeat protein